MNTGAARIRDALLSQMAMLKLAFYCPLVGGKVGIRDCAYCRRFNEGSTRHSGVIECREENLVVGYECACCKAFVQPGTMLDSSGRLLCTNCLMNGVPKVQIAFRLQG